MCGEQRWRADGGSLFHYVGTRDYIWGIRLGHKHLCLLSHIRGPRFQPSFPLIHSSVCSVQGCMLPSVALHIFQCVPMRCWGLNVGPWESKQVLHRWVTTPALFMIHLEVVPYPVHHAGLELIHNLSKANVLTFQEAGLIRLVHHAAVHIVVDFSIKWQFKFYYPR